MTLSITYTIVMVNSKIHTALSLCTLSDESKKLGKISTGDRNSDKFLKGGFLVPSVSEICGAAGTGKTQLAIQCSVSTVLRGYNVIYLITNPVGGFSTKRLIEISEAQLKMTNTRMTSKDVLDMIYIKNVSDWNHLCNRIVKIDLPLLLESCTHIKLLILDDVASIFRFIPSSTVISCELFKLASHLYSLSLLHQISIICINQVTDAIENRVYQDRSWKHPIHSFWQQLPCMGMSWGHCIQTRIFLKKSDPLLYKNSFKRKMYISKSSHLQENSAEFIIDSDGIKMLNRTIDINE